MQQCPCNTTRAALPKSSLDVTRACTSVLRALTGRDDRIRFMNRSCAYAVRQVRLTCAAIDIVESSCTPRSRMLVDAMMLHPHTSMQRGGGYGMRLFGTANNMAPVASHSKAGNVMQPCFDVDNTTAYPFDS